MNEKALKMLMLKKKDEPDMSPEERDARMAILEDIRSQAMDRLGDKLHDAKRVSVASDSPEGLKAGLDKAKEMVGDHEAKPYEGKETPEEEQAEEHEECKTPEDVDRKIAELQALKQKLMEGSEEESEHEQP